MKGIDAAFIVLKEAGEALHYREITSRIAKRGLWESTGKTPEATINAFLAVDIKRHGDQSRFVRVTKGCFALSGVEPTPPPEPPPPVPVEPAPEPPAREPGPGAAEPLTFTNAAEQVLRAFGQRQPMHYKVITERALGMGWLSTSGLTPANSMYAQILTEIAKAQARGERPRFVKHGKGLVGLSSWVRLGIPHQIEAHNRQVRTALHQRLQTLPPTEFEELVGALLSAIGFPEVEVTKRSGDKGIDVRGTLVVADVVRIRMAVQVKRWSSNVQAPVVQQLRGSLGAHEQGLIVTTSDFSKGARDEARRPDATPVALMNGEELVSLLFEHEIGVSRTAFDLFELDEEEG